MEEEEEDRKREKRSGPERMEEKETPMQTPRERAAATKATPSVEADSGDKEGGRRTVVWVREMRYCW